MINIRDRLRTRANRQQRSIERENTGLSLRRWPLSRWFLILALIVAGLFFLSGLSCDSTYGDNSCAEKAGNATTITIVVGVVGWFLLATIQRTGRH